MDTSRQNEPQFDPVTGENAIYSEEYFPLLIDVSGGYEELEVNVGEGESGFTIELWASTPALFAISLTSPSGEVFNEIQPRLGKKEIIRFVLEKTVVNIQEEDLQEVEECSQLLRRQEWKCLDRF